MKGNRDDRKNGIVMRKVDGEFGRGGAPLMAPGKTGLCPRNTGEQ